MSTRIALCDDHRMFCDAVSMAFRLRGIEVVAVAHSPSDLLAVLDDTEIDVAFVDRWFPDSDGLELVGTVAVSHPKLSIIVMSGSLEPDLPSRAFEAGARGFVSKGLRISKFADAIERVQRGELVDERHAGHRSAEIEVAARLTTPKEREVLVELLNGRDTATLAAELGISYTTARTHIQNLLTKLGVHSKLELVAFVADNQLLGSYNQRPNVSGHRVRGPSVEHRSALEHRTPARSTPTKS